MASFFILLVVAGNETTRNAISHGLLALTEHPERARHVDRRLRLRWHRPPSRRSCAGPRPVIHFRRTVTQDGARIGDQTFNEGDKVVLWYCSANRDADGVRRSRSASTSAARRTTTSASAVPGPHFCLGAHLARREITVMFKELFKRMPDIRAVGEPDRLQSNFINGIKHLRAEWTPAAAS